MRNQRKIYTILLGLMCASVASRWVSAQLDTTTGANLDQALVLTSNYTFTNFELARGSVKFRQGFTVPAGVTATFDTYESVSGVMNIAGTLNLAGDLYLDEGASIVSSGQILLNGYTMMFSSQLLINDTFTIAGTPDGIIDGQFHRLTLPTTGGLRLSLPPDSTTTVTLRNMTVENCRATNLVAPGAWGGNFPPTAQLIMDNVRFLAAIDQNLTVTADNIYMYRNVDFAGSNGAIMNLVNNSTGQLRIGSGAELYIGPGLELDYTGLGNGIVFLDTSASIRFNSSRFKWISASVESALKNGTVIIEGNVVFTTGGQDMKFGDGVRSNDLNLVLVAGATLEMANPDALTPIGFIYANTL